ncbi:MAG: hypothetical protein RMJ56_07305 [Gemmataceae bacterium]|nr:VWA domain-containing protein [Gemmata sp.]MDW8197398.1 hypothetical protein [Gemmataceae bacterium]
MNDIQLQPQTTQQSEFIFRRTVDSFDQFSGDFLHALMGHPIAKVLLALALLTLVARVVYRYAHPAARTLGPKAPVARALRIASWVAVAAVILWTLVAFYNRDLEQGREVVETVPTFGSTNDIKWYSFTIGLFILGCFFVGLMYYKDSQSVRWYWAVPLALLRISVYAILCFIFLLPAIQTWEDTQKQSRVVILLDISHSITSDKATDDVVTKPGQKAKRRIDYIIDFLTDKDVAFLQKLLEKNPVAVYAFGSRLDEAPQLIASEGPVWSREEWEAFATYNFRPHLIRNISREGQTKIEQSDDWQPTMRGDADWATTWAARLAMIRAAAALKQGRAEPGQSLEKFREQYPTGTWLLEMTGNDLDQLAQNLERLEKRIDVARTIMRGTNVPDAITAAINRESANMVQGIIVISDGRSNLGSEASYVELRERARREKIPIFTIVVGEDRQTSAIVISDVLAPDSAPVDEAWEINVEADGVNLANKTVEVELHLFKPGSDFERVDAQGYPLSDYKMTQPMTFAPGDPPRGQVKFVIDPADPKLPDDLTTESKDAAIKKRILKEGKWGVKAVIAKHPDEAAADAFHVRARPNINVVQQKLRILLVTGAPGREFSFLRTLLVREMQDQRATLTTYVQNEAGTKGQLTPEIGETVILRFPNRLDLSNKDYGPDEKPLNLNEYDVIIAFDPDWSELSRLQVDDLARWVREGGGGLIFVAGPINTFQLARVEIPNGNLVNLLEILPVIPADIVAQRIRPTPTTPRRLRLYPERIPGSELLKLDESVPNDPIAGWEPFFTDRDKYIPDPDWRKELFPRRGFFSAYPVTEVKPGSAVLAEFLDVSDTNEPVPIPWIVTNNPSASYRTAYLGNSELYRLRPYRATEGIGRQYFERFWIKLIKYMAAKRNFKAPRGRVLVSKEGISGMPLRVQARILNESAKPYTPADIGAKFKIVQEKNGERREFGPYNLKPKEGVDGTFEGYYDGQVLLEPSKFPPDDSIYRVVVDVPDSQETLTGEFRIRQSDPEMDNRRPDIAAMIRMASEFNKEFQESRLADKASVKLALGKYLPKEAGVQRLAFRLNDKEELKLIPECMLTLKMQNQNRGPIHDLWDTPVMLDLSRSNVFNGLWVLIGSSLLLLLARIGWHYGAGQLSAALRGLIIALWVLANLVIFIGGAVAVAFDPLYVLPWLAAMLVFGLAIFAFRAELGAGLTMLGILLASGVTLAVACQMGDYTGMTVPISIALLVIVLLLGCEWATRKLLRLA